MRGLSRILRLKFQEIYNEMFTRKFGTKAVWRKQKEITWGQKIKTESLQNLDLGR